jgi:hypothetical protein
MCEFGVGRAETTTLGTVDITLRVMHHTECDVYDQNLPPRIKRPWNCLEAYVFGIAFPEVGDCA